MSCFVCLLSNVSICTCVLRRSCALDGKFKSNNYVYVYLSISLSIYYLWSGDSSVVERRTRGQKVAGSSPGMSGGKIFFSRVSFLC